MKRTFLALFAVATVAFYACQKSNDTASQISLTPSTTQTAVGQTVSVALNAKVNASSWTVSPSASVTKTYSITTSKVNYFTFSQPGVYTVSVRARNVAYDSTLHQSLDSCWAHGGGIKGSCTKGVDTASVNIIVVK